MGSLAIFLLIKLSISSMIGCLNSISIKPDLNEQEKTDIFLDSTISGLIWGLLGAIVGHFLGSKSASNVDGLFGCLSAIGSVVEYLKIFYTLLDSLNYWRSNLLL